MAKQTYKNMMLGEVRRLERELEHTKQLLEESRDAVRFANWQVSEMAKTILAATQERGA